MTLQKATRKKAKIRLGVSGPSGCGKTFSALLIAYGICEDWDKIALIDSESGSGHLYADMGPYNVYPLDPDYTPEKYIKAIHDCENAGMQVIIIDSASHEWSGKGGCIESNDLLAKTKYKGNTWSAWNETTPRHQSFIDSILQSKCHIITTTRSKVDTIMTDDKKVKKVGTKDIQREGFEYELTIMIELDKDGHFAITSKDRTSLFIDKPAFVPSVETGKLIRQWCDSGVDIEAELADGIQRIKACQTVTELSAVKAMLPAYVVSHPDWVSVAKEAHARISQPQPITA